MKQKDRSNNFIIKSDPEIVEMYLSRDESAVAQTKLKYGVLIDSVCRGILGDRRDREECENTVYERLWNTIPPEEPRILRAYIIRIARFVSLDKFRAEHRRRRISSDMTEALDDFSDFLTDDYDVGCEVVRRELAAALNEFVLSLPHDQKKLFMWRYYFSRPVSAIAKELGLTTRQIKKDLESIAADLKSKLTEKGLI